MKKNSTRLDALKIELIESLIKIEDKETMEYLKIEKDAKSENRNEVADFEAISARNRLSIAYFGLNYLHRNNPVLRDV